LVAVFFEVLPFKPVNNFCTDSRQMPKLRHSRTFTIVVSSATYDWKPGCILSLADERAMGNEMLRITRKGNGVVVFKVSGQLTAENVAEMEALISAEKKGQRIVLDCTDLRSVDAHAVKSLVRWQADSIKLKNCGLYIRELIRRERRGRKSRKGPEKK
jgi:anti-anti-sigma regulatory factor